MVSEDYLIKELGTEIKIIDKRISFNNEILFWLEIAQIYLDTKTLLGLIEFDKIIEMCRKMRLE